MISVGQEQCLGKKSQILIISRRSTVAILLIIFSLVLLNINSYLANTIASLISSGSTYNSSVIIVSNFISSITLVAFVLAIIAGLMGIIVGILQYRCFVITFDELSLKIRHGFINRNEVLLPYRQIQDIKIDRPLMYRVFGVSRLVLVAAGDEVATLSKNDKDTVFDPIDAELAVEVRSFLERHVGVQIIQDKSEVVLEDKNAERSERKISRSYNQKT